MKTYCYNMVVFEGENHEEILSHFKQMPKDSPPFEAIFVANNKLYFDSRYFPPLHDLNKIAEKFDINYSLDYSINGDKSSYKYTCHQQQTLSQKGEEIRQSINKSNSLSDLQKIDHSLQEMAFSGRLGNHHFYILKQIMGKKHRELNPPPIRDQTEEATRNRSRGR